MCKAGLSLSFPVTDEGRAAWYMFIQGAERSCRARVEVEGGGTWLLSWNLSLMRPLDAPRNWPYLDLGGEGCFSYSSLHQPSDTSSSRTAATPTSCSTTTSAKEQLLSQLLCLL